MIDPPEKLLVPTIVNGHLISIDHISKAYKWLKTKKSFRFLDVTLALSHSGVEYGALDRGADRLLQRMRRNGLVEYNKNRNGL